MTFPICVPVRSKGGSRAPFPGLALSAALVLAASTGLFACRHVESQHAPKPPTPVRVRAVVPSTAASGVRYSGSVEPATHVDLAFKVGGYVRELAQVRVGAAPPRRVQEGDFIKKNTILAVVREADHQQRLASAQAAYSEALAAKKQAQLDADRAAKLVATNSISTAEADGAQAKLDAANARVQGAKSRIGEAELALSDCTLRAPMDGVILKRSVEVGSLVSPGSPGFALADMRTVKVVYGAPDVAIEKLRLGAALTVAFEAVAGDFTGAITRIAPSADPKSRVFDVEVSISNPKDQIKAGMIASLKVPEGALSQSALVLPLTAVVRSPHDPRGFSVFVVEGDVGSEIAHLRDVTLGDVMGNTVLVASGLKSGERAISMGSTLVSDGEPVRVIP